MVLSPLFTNTASGFPSPLMSASTTENGLDPTAKQLRREEQFADILHGNYTEIAGARVRGKEDLRRAPELAEKYGGHPDEWTRITSSSRVTADGEQTGTHAYRNQETTHIVEPKEKIEKDADQQ